MGKGKSEYHITLLSCSLYNKEKIASLPYRDIVVCKSWQKTKTDGKTKRKRTIISELPALFDNTLQSEYKPGSLGLRVMYSAYSSTTACLKCGVSLFLVQWDGAPGVTLIIMCEEQQQQARSDHFSYYMCSSLLFKTCRLHYTQSLRGYWLCSFMSLLIRIFP